MRARRIAFFGLTALSFFALLYTGERIYLWIILFQLSILAIAGINILITFAGVRFVQQVTPDRAVKGEAVTLRLEIHNELFLPFAHLTMLYSTPDTQYTGVERRFSASLLPRSREVLSASISCQYRGEYRMGFTRIEATDLFGLLRISYPFSIFTSYQPAALLVYPMIRPILPGSLINREKEGPTDTNLARAEELSSIAEIRNFRDGDPLKRIHWKLSARNRKLLVKEFEGTLSADSVVLLDCTAHSFHGEAAAKFEDTLVECATAFCKRMTEDYQPITLIAYSSERTEIAGSAPVDFPAFYDTLARIRFRGDLSLASAIKLERTRLGNLGSLVIITQSPTDDLFEVLVTLSENDCRITLVTVLDNIVADERMIRMLGEFSLRGIRAVTVFPGEDISQRMGGIL